MNDATLPCGRGSVWFCTARTGATEPRPQGSDHGPAGPPKVMKTLCGKLGWQAKAPGPRRFAVGQALSPANRPENQQCRPRLQRSDTRSAARSLALPSVRGSTTRVRYNKTDNPLDGRATRSFQTECRSVC